MKMSDYEDEPVSSKDKGPVQEVNSDSDEEIKPRKTNPRIQRGKPAVLMSSSQPAKPPTRHPAVQDERPGDVSDDEREAAHVKVKQFEQEDNIEELTRGALLIGIAIGALGAVGAVVLYNRFIATASVPSSSPVLPKQIPKPRLTRYE